MEHFIKIIGILGTLAIVYIAMAIYRRLIRNQTNMVWRRLIPMWAVLIGIGLGMIFFVNVPEIMPTTSLFTSMIVGGVAGWASVGANQFARLTFGDDRKRRFYIHADNVVVNEKAPEEETKTESEAKNTVEVVEE